MKVDEHDPERLVENRATPRLRLLLTSAQAERPSELARAQAWRALGLLPSTLLPTGSALKVASLLGRKLVVMVGLGVGIVVTFSVHRPRSVESDKTLPPAASAPTQPNVVAVQSTWTPTNPARAPSLGPSSLAREVRLLDRARAALATGDCARALRVLDSYLHSFPHGELLPEAAVLRIEALQARGDAAAAMSIGNEFLLSHPLHPLGQKVRRLIHIDDQKRDLRPLPSRGGE